MNFRPSKALYSSVALLCCVAFALVLSACGGDSSSSSSTTATGAGAGGEGSESKTAAFASEEPTSEWPSVGGDVGGSRYSTADQIDTSNVAQLKLAFAAPLDPEGTKDGTGSENNPIESEGVIYAASGSMNPTVGAYDASTGEKIWQTTGLDVGIIPGEVEPGSGSRGQAIGEGRLYIEEPGGYLVALDQKTGKMIWKTLINTQRVYQYSQPTPVYWDGMVYIGQSGSDIVGGLRGFVKAVDAKTGKLAWTFHTLPRPGEPGSETWDSPEELKDGGGGVWTNAVVDPELGLVYFPTGNPNPDIGGRGPGDEYYLDGVVALDLKTGKLRWFYQTTHHDEWDYDCAQPPVLWTHEVEGKTVDGLSIGCKNGYVYELDRATGKPVTPVREEPLSNAKTNPEAKAYDEKRGWKKQNGEPLTEPIPVDAGEVTPHCADPDLLPAEAPDGKGYEYACAYSYFGPDHFTAGWNGTSLVWAPTSYNPQTGYTYYCANVGIHAAKVKDLNAKQKDNFKVFEQLEGYGEAKGMVEPRQGWFTAIDVRDNQTAWQVKSKSGIECAGGSSTTAGGLVFVSDSAGYVYAYDAKTGKRLWSWTRKGKGLVVNAPPVIYEDEGTEYVTFVATLEGKAVLLGFALNATEPGPLEPPAAAGKEGGESTFATNCASCHTLKAAEATGTAGPNLDQLQPDAATVESQVITGGHRMPSFKGRLSPAEIKSVAEFVAESAGK